MVDRRHLRALERFTRLLGVGLVGVGILLARSSPVYGVPVVAVGLLFALRPYLGAELLEFSVSLF